MILSNIYSGVLRKTIAKNVKRLRKAQNEQNFNMERMDNHQWPLMFDSSLRKKTHATLATLQIHKLSIVFSYFPVRPLKPFIHSHNQILTKSLPCISMLRVNGWNGFQTGVIS